DNLPAFGIQNDHFAPVRPAFRDQARRPASVTGETQPCERGSAIVRKTVRVQENLRLTAVLLPVQYVLVLQAIVLVEIGPVSFLKRCAVPFIVPQLLQSLPDVIPEGDLRKIIE